ncbi:sugar phosphate isomerase/epimerase [Candidatus Bathyarchaeota archaeon]|nr:sugar phosphate isomerase/epimerase [Candidatus Bathyarchaeota archaeon]MBS7618463.1 sugar phosphate isomerase/epimerase [Candidatus Bathyarchaeota archaeon]
MGKLKISLALWSLGASPDVKTLEDQLRTAAEIGVKGVQLWCVDYGPTLPCVLDPDRCNSQFRYEIRELVKSYGLEISGFCAQLSGPRRFGGLNEEDGLDKRIEKTKKTLKLAADMGSPIVTTHPGRIPRDKNSSIYAIMKKSVSEIARYGEDVGAFFCIETGMEPADVLKSFLEDVGSTALKVNYDPANMLHFGADEVVKGVRTLGRWIVHTHAKDHNPKTRRATVGEGLVPWNDYIAALREIGYKGWFAIEDETGIDVVESITRGKKFLEKYEI